ncbi:MAG: hypothetical protein KDJ31_08495, partial [Candidatus Competibacteraceae bacterium]|nr:hypothetical protein [Candidatus Competibacteraceae bacterium]
TQPADQPDFTRLEISFRAGSPVIRRPVRHPIRKKHASSGRPNDETKPYQEREVQRKIDEIS